MKTWRGAAPGRAAASVPGSWCARSVRAAWARCFVREAREISALNHPNIARLIDGGLADDAPFLVLEYVDGEPLQRWCAEHHLDLEARLRLLLTVCDAVAHAHSRLVVHRDLKPSNILVDRDGQVKLLDFGIAKLLEGEGSREISDPHVHTRLCDTRAGAR